MLTKKTSPSPGRPDADPTPVDVASQDTLTPNDLLADWRALALAWERREPEEITAQLRAVAGYASETLLELVDGMTWREQAGDLPVVVKLSERQAAWSYCLAYGVSEVRSTSEFPTKAAARDDASAAVAALRARITNGG